MTEKKEPNDPAGVCSALSVGHDPFQFLPLLRSCPLYFSLLITLLALKLTISDYTPRLQHHNLPSMSSTSSNNIDKRAFPGKDCLYAHLTLIPSVCVPHCS